MRSHHRTNVGQRRYVGGRHVSVHSCRQGTGAAGIPAARDRGWPRRHHVVSRGAAAAAAGGFRSTIRGVSTFAEDDVRRLARLARLDLDPDEITAFTQQLGDILEFARQIQSVETDAIADDAQPDASPLREDARLPSLPREEVRAAAPDHDPATGLIKVPRVLGS